MFLMLLNGLIPCLNAIELASQVLLGHFGPVYRKIASILLIKKLDFWVCLKTRCASKRDVVLLAFIF